MTMEEKKNPKGQVKERLSYDELKRVAGELDQQNQRLVEQINKMQAALEQQAFDQTSFFLSMLFRVMDHSDQYSAEFVKWCKDGIEGALTSFAKAMNSEKENEAE